MPDESTRLPKRGAQCTIPRRLRLTADGWRLEADGWRLTEEFDLGSFAVFNYISRYFGFVLTFSLQPSAFSLQPMRSIVVIPARLASTRLPQKMLLNKTGKTLIQHTYEAAMKARHPVGVFVATDHADIFHAVNAFGGNAVMTSAAARSGTDRVAEVASPMTDVDVFVNVQGDEPEISAAAIDQVIDLLEQNPKSVMSTLATPIRSKAQLLDPACVKVVFDNQSRALYFSRSPIPHAREWRDDLLTQHPPHFYQHLGIYAYRRDFLLQLARLPASSAEKLESLEQLRVLAAGYSILVGTVVHHGTGIDTWDDYWAFVSRMQNC
jgi:3-deoxy-manno-octulosonate cytidylyltransferase (CMP-KDO synthetase)